MLISVLQGGNRYVFFFFQAEDGIRDWSVTGVQTCALPISEGLELGATHFVHRIWALRRSLLSELYWPFRGSYKDPLENDLARSEERRVGKSVDLSGRLTIKKNSSTDGVSAEHRQQSKRRQQ